MKAILFFLFPITLFAQEFEYIHQNNGESEFLSGTILKESLIVAGTTTEKYRPTSQGLLLGLNLQGDTLWTKKVGQPTENSQVVAVTSVQDKLVTLNRINQQTIVSAYESTGQLLWDVIIPEIEFPVAITEHDREIYLLGSGPAEDPTINSALWMVKVSIEGKVIRTKELLQGDRIKPYDMTISSNGDIAITLNNRVDGKNQSFLFKFDSLGELLWKLSLSGQLEYGFTVEANIDNEIIVGGESPGGNAALMAISGNGALLWSQELPGDTGNFRLYDILHHNDKVFAVGRTNQALGLLTTFGSKGEILEQKNYTGLGKAALNALIMTPNESIFLIGVTLNRRGAPSGFLVKD